MDTEPAANHVALAPDMPRPANRLVRSPGTGRSESARAPLLSATAERSSEQTVRGYLADLSHAMQQIDIAELASLVDTIADALVSGRRVFIAGNGGSGAAAIHMASDWTMATASLPNPAHIVALNENIARLTAIANDHSFEEIFSAQLAGRGCRGDTLLVLSVSGNSSNLVRAATIARYLGITVLAVLGNPGAVAAEADRVVFVGSRDYGLSEDLQVSLTHMVVRLFLGGAHTCQYAPANERRSDDDASRRAAR